MTKKDFFVLVVKLFGLYTLITTLFSVIPSLLSVSQFEFDIYTSLYVVVSLTFFALLFLYLLFHAEKVVDFLKLDKGFDSESIQIEKLEKVQVIQLGLIIVGGLIFLEHLPGLLTNSFYFIKAQTQRSASYEDIHFRTPENYVYLMTDFISVVLGYLLLNNHEKIADKLR